MLPHDLADDLCSLRPHQDRLCVTVEIPPHGEPSFYRSVIRSDARLTYGQAQRRDAEPHILEALDLNDELAQSLRAKRFARGALQVQTPEVVFRFDGRGGVAEAWLEGEPHAHMLVEELMILANELVGAFLAGRRRETLYRVHEQPDPLSVEHLLAKLANLGVPTPPAPDRLTPQQAAKLAGEISSRIAEYVEQSGRGREAFPGARAARAQAGALRPAQPRPLRPREHGVCAFHLADPPLSRPDHAPLAPARARPLRRPRARRPGVARRARVGARARSGEARVPRRRHLPRVAPRQGALRARLGGGVGGGDHRHHQLRSLHPLRRRLRRVPARTEAARRVLRAERPRHRTGGPRDGEGLSPRRPDRRSRRGDRQERRQGRAGARA